MEFLILTAALVIGCIIGWYAREQVAINTIKRIIAEAEAEAEDFETEKSPDRLRLERHGEVIYAYSEDEFIGQGADLTTLDEVIQKRFPGRKFLVQKENLEEMAAEHERI
jgi:hypothetical protein